MTIKTPDSVHTPGPIDTLIADCRIARKKLIQAPIDSFEKLNDTLTGDVYPMFVAILEQIIEVEDVIQEVVDQQDSYIQPELASQIFNTITAAATLADEVKKLQLDDLAKKKITGLIALFEQSAEITVMSVSQAIASDEDEGGDDGSDDDESDDEDEEEDEEAEEAEEDEGEGG